MVHPFRSALLVIFALSASTVAPAQVAPVVITQASVISPSQVYQALGVAPFVQNAPTLRTIPAAATAAAASHDGADGSPRAPSAATAQHAH